MGYLSKIIETIIIVIIIIYDREVPRPLSYCDHSSPFICVKLLRAADSLALTEAQVWGEVRTAFTTKNSRLMPIS